MTTLQAISATAAAGIFGIFVMLVLCLRHGHAQFELGWREGWDDRDNDRYPDSPEPKGRHHMSAEEAETAIAQFLIDSGVEAEPLPPLPKRIPGASI